jgi:hypothetical protein
MPPVSVVNCYVVVILNVLTDLYLLYIPILVRHPVLLNWTCVKLTKHSKMLWTARISLVKKSFLMVLFSGGLFVITASILRAYGILAGGSAFSFASTCASVGDSHHYCFIALFWFVSGCVSLQRPSGLLRLLRRDKYS